MVFFLFNNNTITSNGSAPVSKFGSSEIIAIINITAAPTGTSPTIVFTMQEVDPIDQITPLSPSVSTSVISSAFTTILQLNNCVSDTVLVSWTIGGSGVPTFTGVNVSVMERYSGGTTTAAPGRVSTNNITSVAAATSSVTLLSSNSFRLGATIYNDSTTNTLYLKLGTNASTSSYSVKLIPNAYFEVPYDYTGEIDGIWDGTIGNARVTELS
jgi:hypothetical protein